MLKRFANASQILTVDSFGSGRKKGQAASVLNILSGHDIIVENGLVKDFIPFHSPLTTAHRTVDVKGKVITPGFVECHTHSLFAGDRSAEYRMKLEGKSYEDIAAMGGGIVSSVRAVRETPESDLLTLLLKRVDNFISQGVTSLEIKSGYGLSYDAELKMLRVIKKAASLRNINIIPCFLGAHTVPIEYKQDRKKYLSILINELLPVIKAENLSNRCDAFCESSAFSPDEVEQLFIVAKSLGYNLTLHTEQFNNIGGIELALQMDALSVDHLEVLKDEQIKLFGDSQTVAVLLPGVSYTLDYSFAPARKLIDSGATVALATDYNPGTSNINSIFLIMSLAARKLKMTFEEIISAYTINSAAALGISNETGSLEPGKSADFAILDISNYEQIIYNTAQNFNQMTVKSGKIIYNKSN
ncbi:MAG: imidazolonepropionase [Ignavibacteriaceae bacterium]|jgi:imidazolonepropionase|nr:imidazolonepropionase [Ignavibacteriaceae bacterium]